jgi:hypothetical protein
VGSEKWNLHELQDAVTETVVEHGTALVEESNEGKEFSIYQNATLMSSKYTLLNNFLNTLRPYNTGVLIIHRIQKSIIVSWMSTSTISFTQGFKGGLFQYFHVVYLVHHFKYVD